MSNRIQKSSVLSHSGLYIWQTCTYAKDYFELDEPADIYQWKPMPCTPAGDLIKEFETAQEAIEYLQNMPPK